MKVDTTVLGEPRRAVLCCAGSTPDDVACNVLGRAGVFDCHGCRGVWRGRGVRSRGAAPV